MDQVYPRRPKRLDSYLPCGLKEGAKALRECEMASIDEDVFSKVQAALVDALGVDDDEVTPEATMVGDLEPSRSTF